MSNYIQNISELDSIIKSKITTVICFIKNLDSNNIISKFDNLQNFYPTSHILFYKYRVDNETTTRYNISNNMPHFIVFKNNKIINEYIGDKKFCLLKMIVNLKLV